MESAVSTCGRVHHVAVLSELALLLCFRSTAEHLLSPRLCSRPAASDLRAGRAISALAFSYSSVLEPVAWSWLTARMFANLNVRIYAGPRATNRLFSWALTGFRDRKLQAVGTSSWKAQSSIVFGRELPPAPPAPARPRGRQETRGGLAVLLSCMCWLRQIAFESYMPLLPRLVRTGRQWLSCARLRASGRSLDYRYGLYIIEICQSDFT